jgi:hypothetical protein
MHNIEYEYDFLRKKDLNISGSAYKEAKFLINE